MFTLYNAQIDAIALHRVGNKSRNEPFIFLKIIFNWMTRLVYC